MVKADVLAALDAARGKYISGQELAQQLGVSRTAIWKAVAALRADGIPVAAVTNRGYILSPAADVLNAAAVTALLAPEAARALQVEVVDRLPGTNAALRARAENGAPEGLVLIAQAQSAGRGRGGHSFFSPQGGLYLSILLRPEIGLRQAVRLTAMAAVAACRAAEKVSGAELRIKWVNDLWRDGRKVCGILTEAALDMESGMLDYAVLGLGFNITAPPDGWPAELQDVAGAPCGTGSRLPQRVLGAVPRRAQAGVPAGIPCPPGAAGPDRDGNAPERHPAQGGGAGHRRGLPPGCPLCGRAQFSAPARRGSSFGKVPVKVFV